MSNEELVIKIQNGIDTAENMLKLWEQTKKFISMIAKKYSTYAELEDLEQEGYLALYDAVDHYKGEMGIPFISYAAYWIKQKMERYIKNCCQAVRVPMHECEYFSAYRKNTAKFYKENGREPSRREIADSMGLSAEKIGQIERNMMLWQVCSLDIPTGEDTEETLCDFIMGNINIETDTEQEQLKAELYKAVDDLPEEQKKVIYMRYWKAEGHRHISERMGCNENQTRRIETKALHNLYHSKIGSFFDDVVGSSAYRHNGVSEFNRTWTSSTERAVLKVL